MYANAHTRLMNKFIGLCNNTDEWPPIMYKMGYRIQLVEQKITLDADSVTPDVIVMSNRLSHAVVVDCKSGTHIDSKQDRKYKSIMPKHLFNWLDIKEESRFKYSACYASNDSNYDKLSAHTELPFVVFGAMFIEGKGDFAHDNLNRVLHQQISIGDKHEPTLLYPFSLDDDEYLILRHVIRALIVWLGRNCPKSYSELIKRETLIDILKIMHPHYKHMGDKHRHALQNKTKKTLASILDRNEFNTIRNKMLEDEVTTSLWKKFTEQCLEVIEERKVQPTLD